MAIKTVQLFYNTTAGGKAQTRCQALARAFETLGARVITSDAGPHAPMVIDAAADHVCAIGGDGTVRHLVMAVRDSGRDIAISVYPEGTINLIARETQPPRDATRFARHVLSAEPKRQYAVEIDDTLSIACISVGPDAVAVAGVSSALKRRLGRMAYGWSMLAVLSRWPSPHITLQWDGGTLDCSAFYVAKGRYYAGPWSFAPDASVESDTMHVVALKRARRRDWMHFAMAVMLGRGMSASNVVRFTCSALSAQSKDAAPVQADGDITGSLPATMRVDPRGYLYV